MKVFYDDPDSFHKNEAEVIEMFLCETEQVILRPDQLYIFRVSPSCKRCKKLAKSYKDQESI